MLLPALFSHPSLSARCQAKLAWQIFEREPSATVSAELKISAIFRKRDSSTPGCHPCASHSSRRLSICTMQTCCSGVSSTESVETGVGEASTGLAGGCGNGWTLTTFSLTGLRSGRNGDRGGRGDNGRCGDNGG